ncbi:hypothetical protein R6Q57_022518 [Mikania cordata]
MIKVVIPKNIKSRQKNRQIIALHHTAGFVCRCVLNKSRVLVFMVSGDGLMDDFCLERKNRAIGEGVVVLDCGDGVQ